MTWFGLRGAASALREIERSCGSGLDAQRLLEDVAVQVREVLDVDAFFVAAADPETTLCMGAGVLQDMPAEMCQPLWDNEFFVPDFNKFTDLARGPRAVADLHAATGGRPTRSPRWRTLHAITGWESELRAAFAVDGAAWGLASFHRMPESGRFSDAEVAWVDDVARVVARGLRAALLGHPGVGATRGPGVIVLDAAGSIASMTPEAEAWLDEVEDWTPGRGVRGPMPFRVLAEAAALRARGGEGDDPVARRMRIRTRAGVWLLLHVSFLPASREEDARAVLVIEPARASDVAPLIIEAYGLTDREVEVARMIARGMKTAEIAERLFLSAHTVRDHVKAIFEKVGVSSRGEMVAKVFAEHHLDGVHEAMGVAAQRLPFATSDFA
jgi:DNA-binding CsgD family transcriptional regulator